MAKKKLSQLATLGATSRASAERLAQQDRALEEERSKEAYRLASLEVGQIKDRINPETRALKPQLVLELLHSIAEVGLIEPLAVDIRHRLLAGGHRLTALRLLNESKEDALKRFEALKPSPEQDARFQALLETHQGKSPQDIPVHVFDFDSKVDTERAFTIETAENTVRRDYTPKEVLDLYHRMEGMEGYTTREGRPKAGEQPVIPALSAILGKSVSTVKRYLRQAAEEEAAKKAPEEAKRKKARKALLDLKRHLRRFERAAASSEELAPLRTAIASAEVTQALQGAEKALEVEGD